MKIEFDANNEADVLAVKALANGLTVTAAAPIPPLTGESMAAAMAPVPQAPVTIPPFVPPSPVPPTFVPPAEPAPKKRAPRSDKGKSKDAPQTSQAPTFAPPPPMYVPQAPTFAPASTPAPVPPMPPFAPAPVPPMPPFAGYTPQAPAAPAPVPPPPPAVTPVTGPADLESQRMSLAQALVTLNNRNPGALGAIVNKYQFTAVGQLSPENVISALGEAQAALNVAQ